MGCGTVQDCYDVAELDDGVSVSPSVINSRGLRSEILEVSTHSVPGGTWTDTMMSSDRLVVAGYTRSM